MAARSKPEGPPDGFPRTIPPSARRSFLARLLRGAVRQADREFARRVRTAPARASRRRCVKPFPSAPRRTERREHPPREVVHHALEREPRQRDLAALLQPSELLG